MTKVKVELCKVVKTTDANIKVVCRIIVNKALKEYYLHVYPIVTNPLTKESYVDGGKIQRVFLEGFGKFSERYATKLLDKVGDEHTKIFIHFATYGFPNCFPVLE